MKEVSNVPSAYLSPFGRIRLCRDELEQYQAGEKERQPSDSLLPAQSIVLVEALPNEAETKGQQDQGRQVGAPAKHESQ